MLPAASGVYTSVLDVVPYAVCLLLLSSDKHGHGKSKAGVVTQLGVPFALGAAGTFLSAVLLLVLPMPTRFMPLQHAPLAALLAAFAATYIGGSVNFIAVINALRIPPHLVAAAISVDMLCMALYFALLFALASVVNRNTRGDNNKDTTESETKAETITWSSSDITPATLQGSEVKRNVRDLFSSLFLCVAVVQGAGHVTSMMGMSSTFSLVLSSCIAYLVSFLRRPTSSQRQQPHSNNPLTDGVMNFALCMFFACMGAATKVSVLLQSTHVSLALLLYALLILVGHAAVLYFVGYKVMNIAPQQLLIASNCNVGGATTAPVYAACCGWNAYIPSSIAMGTLGYVIATPLALLIVKLAGVLFST